MTEEERNLEILKLITGAEHHFNNLTFNIRALASTWLLATFAGVGWVLNDLPQITSQSEAGQTSFVIDKVDLLLALCVGSAVGIFVLWVLDIRIYQQMTNVWFDSRKKYEVDDTFPSIRVGMKDLFKTGRATELIIVYYLALTAAPLLLALFIAHAANESSAMWFIGCFLLLLTSAIYLLSPKDEKWMQEKLKKIKRNGGAPT